MDNQETITTIAITLIITLGFSYMFSQMRACDAQNGKRNTVVTMQREQLRSQERLACIQAPDCKFLDQAK